MVTRTFFNNYNHTNEQDLYEGLIIESIQIYGVDIWYIPRTLNAYDEIYTEDTLSSYDRAIQVEVYVKNIDGFGGDGMFLSKFDFEIRDQVTFTIAKRVFEGDVGRHIDRNVPKEGDVIYFPMNKKPFQIKYVDYKPFFYQFGTLQTYDLVCELFEYSSEVFNTGVEEIDEIMSKYSMDTKYREDDDFPILDFNPLADNEPIQTEQEEDDLVEFNEADPYSKNGRY